MKCKQELWPVCIQDCCVGSGTAKHGLSDVVEQARQDDAAATAVLGPWNGMEYLCGSDACEMVVRVVLGDSAEKKEQRLQCQHCKRFFEFPCIEWQWESGRLFEVMEQARQGNQAAKAALLLILETERKPAILRKLSLGDVRPQDRGDAHHDILVQIARNIGRLRSSRAYFAWERRIVNDVCRKWRRNYRAFGEPLETGLREVEGTHQSQENF